MHMHRKQIGEKERHHNINWHGMLRPCAAFPIRLSIPYTYSKLNCSGRLDTSTASNDVKNVHTSTTAAAVGPEPPRGPACGAEILRKLRNWFVRGLKAVTSYIDSSKLIGSSPTACSKPRMKFCGLWERVPPTLKFNNKLFISVKWRIQCYYYYDM